jgi:uncharacterized protein (DUF488 family)
VTAEKTAQENQSAGTLYTVGHSTRPIEELLTVLEEADIQLLVDVRTVPRSRRNPQFDGGMLSDELDSRGIAYWHEPAMGGFRQPTRGSLNSGWEHPAFQGYADHMTSGEFVEALDRLQAMARERPACLLCAEAQWWRCHRRLISDARAIRGWRVLHLGLSGGPAEHQLTPFALVDYDDSLVYPSIQGRLQA